MWWWALFRNIFCVGCNAQYIQTLPRAMQGADHAAAAYVAAPRRFAAVIYCHLKGRASPADGGASFFENLPEGGALGEAAGGISRATTLSPRSPRPGGADDAGVAGAAEADIQRALLVGNYAAALDACLAVRPCALSTKLPHACLFRLRTRMT